MNSPSLLLGWCLILWLLELAWSVFISRPLGQPLGAFTVEEWSEAGGLFLLEGVRLHRRELEAALATCGVGALGWAALSLPVTLQIFRTSRPLALGAPPRTPGTWLRFTCLSAIAGVTELGLVLLLGLGVLLTLRSNAEHRIEAALGLIALWTLGRGAAAAFFDLARLSATEHSGYARALLEARARIRQRGLVLILSRAAVGPISVALSIGGLLLLERSVNESAWRWGTAFGGLQLIFLLGHLGRAAWLWWAQGWHPPRAPQERRVTNLP